MLKEGLEYSVVIPVFNEEENLEPLLAELFPIMRGLEKPFEVICVDDASRDASVAVLEKMQQRYPELVVARHRSNCGESAAEATGFALARGEWIITMDADQQNDPNDIPAMLEMAGDSDAVCGVRRRREDDWVKRVSSRVANGFRNRVTGDVISDSGCTFRLLRRSALREVPRFNGMHRFLPTLLRLQGYRVREMVVNHRPRTRGESKYGIGNRAFRGMVDCLAIRWWRKRCFPTERRLA